MKNLFLPYLRLGIRRKGTGLVYITSMLVIVCLVIGGCGESSNTVDSSNRNLSETAAKNPSSGGASATAWSPDDPLMPTGDCIQDTENLQLALHHSNMDNGGTLYLGPGTFMVCATLLRHDIPGEFGYNPVPFNGTIQGSGKGVTIIKSVRGPGGEPFTPSSDGFPITFAVWSLDYFGVRDLTFEADSEIADLWDIGWYPPTRGLLSYVNVGGGVYGAGNPYGSDCINVHFKGSLDSGGDPEIPLMFEVFGGGGGTHNVKSCEFENGSFLMLEYGEVGNTTINVGGSPKEKVTYSNTTDEQCMGISTCSAAMLQSIFLTSKLIILPVPSGTRLIQPTACQVSI